MTAISPNVLEFKAPFTEPSTEIITITNNSEQPIAFKVKTTAPKVYCVRPNASVLEPGSSIEVSVILLGLKDEPSADFKCNDKFLIVSLPSPYDLGENKVAEVWPKLEAEFKAQSVSKKIKVKYNFGSTKSTADGIEDTKLTPNAIVVDEETSKKVPRDASSAAVTDTEGAEDRSKIDELNDRLDSNVANSSSAKSATTATTSPSSSKSSSTTNTKQKKAESSSIFSITTILLIIAIALIVRGALSGGSDSNSSKKGE